MIAQVNGIDIYYEKSGSGQPIILVHGNSLEHKIFNQIIEPLSNHFTVYAVDSRGHGKSSKVSEFNYQDMVDDMIEFICFLQLQNPILYGFSDGGIIGLLIASQHPSLLSKLIISGANITPEGLKNGFRYLFKTVYFVTRNKKIKMVLDQPNITSEELKKITTPTLVLAGSKDLIKEEHTRFIALQIPNSTINIIKGEGHGSYVIHSPKLSPIILTFCRVEIH